MVASIEGFHCKWNGLYHHQNYEELVALKSQSLWIEASTYVDTPTTVVDVWGLRFWLWISALPRCHCKHSLDEILQRALAELTKWSGIHRPVLVELTKWSGIHRPVLVELTKWSGIHWHMFTTTHFRLLPCYHQHFCMFHYRATLCKHFNSSQKCPLLINSQTMCLLQGWILYCHFCK